MARWFWIERNSAKKAKKKNKKKRTDGRWKKGDVTHSSQAEKANMRLYISVFLQKHSLLSKKQHQRRVDD